MKWILTVLCVLIYAMRTSAQNTLIINQKDGQQFLYGFDKKPVIKYFEKELILKTADAEVYYPFSSIAKFSFIDTESDICEIRNGSKTPEFSIEKGVVLIKGVRSGTTVSVIGLDGKIYNTFKIAKGGAINFSINTLHKGVFVIKADNLTCKILKK